MPEVSTNEKRTRFCNQRAHKAVLSQDGKHPRSIVLQGTVLEHGQRDELQ